MDFHNILVDALRKIVHLNEQEAQFIEAHAEYKAYKKGDLLTREGAVENYVYFVVEGAVRNYFNQQGEELSVDFFFEGSFTNSFMSFLLREKSTVSMEALTDTKTVRVHYDHIQKLYETSLNLNKLGRIIAEQLYIRRTKRELSFITHTARERYDDLLAAHPEFVQRIPLKYLASFLGINPETLSRIRKAPKSKKPAG